MFQALFLSLGEDQRSTLAELLAVQSFQEGSGEFFMALAGESGSFDARPMSQFRRQDLVRETFQVSLVESYDGLYAVGKLGQSLGPARAVNHQ